LIVLLIAVVIVVLRLGDLQILRADDFREQAAEALLLRPQTLPFVRGSILDRTGRKLASDEPSWDVKIDYGILAKDPGYLDARARRLRGEHAAAAELTDAQSLAALHDEISRMWSELAQFGGEPIEDIRLRATEIRDRVARIREVVAARRGFDSPVREERLPHAILTGLDDQQQIAARRLFGRYPWVQVEATAHRVYHDAECLGHVLGRTGPVDAEQMARDLHADDDLRCYRGDETVGIAGVEFAAEDLLRGRRGRFREDRRGNVIEDTPPQPGGDVHLTVRYDLQQKLYDLIGDALPRLPYSPGGSIVVLDVPTRDVLAMVSYPAYDPNRFSDIYKDLQGDMIRIPLSFRAVANRYAPGSIVKPLTCLTGLSSGKITLDTRFECTGYLFPDNPEAGASKCWAIHGTGQRKAHGQVNVVEALVGSCNIFAYRVGMAVGVDRLCGFFDTVGFGHFSGTGLPEENRGINPTPSWLNDHAGRPVYRSDPRLFAIGQGELAATPVQVANLMATYAAGTYSPVRLIRERGGGPEWQLPVTAEHLLAVHQGLYGVVNAPSGTAYRTTHFVHDRYALCGKTGSATAQPRPVSYKITYTEPGGESVSAIVPAGSRCEATDKFTASHPQAELDWSKVVVHRRYPDRPPAGSKHAHAWFAGYLQQLDSAGRPQYDVMPRIAFAVLVEYGGSGGRASGPIGRDVARILIETLGDELDPDAPSQTFGSS